MFCQYFSAYFIVYFYRVFYGYGTYNERNFIKRFIGTRKPFTKIFLFENPFNDSVLRILYLTVKSFFAKMESLSFRERPKEVITFGSYHDR